MNENIVEISGQIVGEFEFDHRLGRENFYKNMVRIERNSGRVDVIPIIVSDRVFDLSYSWTDEFVELHGSYRSRNRHRDDGSVKLELYVFVEYGDGLECWVDKNHIELDGYIVKGPTLRKTPQGKDIADVILAVNRANGRADYIPLIFWGRWADYVSTLDVGTNINVVGRIQSREYIKRFSETEFETRVAYEVSVQSVWEV